MDNDSISGIMQITKSRISRNPDEIAGGTLSRSRSPTHSGLDFYRNKSKTINHNSLRNPTYDLN